MKVLVTGGAGFIGSHMADRLVADGHDVIVFAIRVQVTRASSLMRSPDIAAAMAAHLRSWDEPTRAYKFAGTDLFQSFIGWLDRLT